MLTTLVSRVRRNHALEHATIHMLSDRHKGFSAQGNSTPHGFHLNIYGEIEEADVVAAVEEAYRRLKQGEGHLGLHPNCGTVLLTTATMAVAAVQASVSIEQRRQRRRHVDQGIWLGALPLAILLSTVALIISRPVGMSVQAALTVESDLGDMRLASIRKVGPSPVTRLFQFLLGQIGNDSVHSYKIRTLG